MRYTQDALVAFIWLLASTFGLTVGVVTVRLTIEVLDSVVLGLLLVGFFLALTQTVVLWPVLRRAWLWLPVTVVGIVAHQVTNLLMAYATTFAIFSIPPLAEMVRQQIRPPTPDPLIGWLFLLPPAVAAGAVLGLGQWLVLRRSVPRAGWWILANAIGGIWLARVLGEVFLVLTRSGPFASRPLSELWQTPAVSGAWYALVTGIALALLVHQVHALQKASASEQDTT